MKLIKRPLDPPSFIYLSLSFAFDVLSRYSCHVEPSPNLSVLSLFVLVVLYMYNMIFYERQELSCKSTLLFVLCNTCMICSTGLLLNYSIQSYFANMSFTSTVSTSSQNGAWLKRSIESASSLMALQLLSRAVTFILNQALFRLASPSAFGIAAIQFEFILATILFLSREGVRCALLRVNPRLDADAARLRMNLSFLPIIFGVPIAWGTSVLYLHYAGQVVKRQPHFESAITLYALAAMTELLSEPMYNLFVKFLLLALDFNNFIFSEPWSI